MDHHSLPQDLIACPQGTKKDDIPGYIAPKIQEEKNSSEYRTLTQLALKESSSSRSKANSLNKLSTPEHSEAIIISQPQSTLGSHLDLSSIGPMVPSNIPLGLEFLDPLDHVYIAQVVDGLEGFFGLCETNNKYNVKDSVGDLYTASEDTGCCTKHCFGPVRPFDMKLKDNQDREVMQLTRSFACSSCFCPCWLQSMEVFAPPGKLAGRIEQEWSMFYPKFVIKNSEGEIVLRIEGPFCSFSCCSDLDFQILSEDGEMVVGIISKKWGGIVQEAFTDADNFGINFPRDLDVRIKAVTLGACILIDYMYFEKSKNKLNGIFGLF